jgi:hypothetical protein
MAEETWRRDHVKLRKPEKAPSSVFVLGRNTGGV